MKKGLKTYILAVAAGLCFSTSLFSADYSFKKGDLSVDANTYVINILASKDLDGDKKPELIVKLNTGEFGIGFTTPASSRLAKFVPIIVKGQTITDIAVGDIYNDRTNAIAIVAGKNVYVRKYLSGNDTFQQVGVIDLYKEKEYSLDKEENQKLTRVGTEKDLNGKCVAIGDVDADMKNEVIVTKNDAWLFARSPTFIVQVFKFDQNANTFKSIFLSDENLGDGMENITVDRVNNFNMFLVGNRLFALKLGRFGFVHNGISGIGKIGDSKVVAFCGIDSRIEKDKTIGIIQVHQQGQFRDDLTPDRFKNQGTLQIMELKKKGKYPPEFVTTAVEDFQSLAYADFDGDGKMDLIANCKEGFTVVKEGRFTAIKPGIDPVEALKIFAKGKYDNWEYKVGKLFQKEDFDAERVNKVVDSEEQEKLKWTNEEKEFKLGDIAYLQKKDEEAITHYKACIAFSVQSPVIPGSPSDPAKYSQSKSSVLAPKSLVTPDVSPLVIPEGVSRGSIAFKDNVWSKYAHLRLADLYYKLKNKPEAEKVLLSLIANYPDFENIGRAYLKLGYICQEQKRYKEAKDHYLKVKEAMKPKERPKDLEFRFATCAVESGAYEEAIPVLEKLDKDWWEAEGDIYNYMVHYYLGKAYEETNNLAESYKWYKRYVGNTLNDALHRTEILNKVKLMSGKYDTPKKTKQDYLVYFGEDYVTKGDWVGAYGEHTAIHCAGNGFQDINWGKYEGVFYHAREEKKPPRIPEIENSLIYTVDIDDPSDETRYFRPNLLNAGKAALANPFGRFSASWDDHGEVYDRKRKGPDLIMTLDIPKGNYILSFYTYWGARRHEMKVFNEQDEIIDERNVGDFNGGVYYRYFVEGGRKLKFRLYRGNSINTTMSGVFLDPYLNEKMETGNDYADSSFYKEYAKLSEKYGEKFSYDKFNELETIGTKLLESSRNLSKSDCKIAADVFHFLRKNDTEREMRSKYYEFVFREKLKQCESFENTFVEIFGKEYIFNENDYIGSFIRQRNILDLVELFGSSDLMDEYIFNMISQSYKYEQQWRYFDNSFENIERFAAFKLRGIPQELLKTRITEILNRVIDLCLKGKMADTIQKSFGYDSLDDETLLSAIRYQFKISKNVHYGALRVFEILKKRSKESRFYAEGLALMSEKTRNYPDKSISLDFCEEYLNLFPNGINAKEIEERISEISN